MFVIKNLPKSHQVVNLHYQYAGREIEIIPMPFFNTDKIHVWDDSGFPSHIKMTGFRKNKLKDGRWDICGVGEDSAYIQGYINFLNDTLQGDALFYMEFNPIGEGLSPVVAKGKFHKGKLNGEWIYGNVSLNPHIDLGVEFSRSFVDYTCKHIKAMYCYGACEGAWEGVEEQIVVENGEPQNDEPIAIGFVYENTVKKERKKKKIDEPKITIVGSFRFTINFRKNRLDGYTVLYEQRLYSSTYEVRHYVSDTLSGDVFTTYSDDLWVIVTRGQNVNEENSRLETTKYDLYGGIRDRYVSISANNNTIRRNEEWVPNYDCELFLESVDSSRNGRYLSYTEYYPNGQIRVRGNFDTLSYCTRVGTWKFFQENGSLGREEHWQKIPKGFMEKIDPAIISKGYVKYRNSTEYHALPYNFRDEYYCALERTYNTYGSGEVFHENVIILTDSGFLGLTYVNNDSGILLLGKRIFNFGKQVEDYAYWPNGKLALRTTVLNSKDGTTFIDYDQDGKMRRKAKFFHSRNIVSKPEAYYASERFFSNEDTLLELRFALDYDNLREEIMRTYLICSCKEENYSSLGRLEIMAWDKDGKCVFMNDTGTFYSTEYFIDNNHFFPGAVKYIQASSKSCYYVCAKLGKKSAESKDTIVTEIMVREVDRISGKVLVNERFETFNHEHINSTIEKALDVLWPYIQDKKLAKLPE